MRRISTLLSAAFVALGLLTAGGTASTADVGTQAYPTCNTYGTPTTYRNGNYITLQVYWDGANGTNCAYLRHGSAAPGGRIRTFVHLWTCTTATPGAFCTARGPLGSRYQDRDIDYYYDYAGKVTVDGRDRCIYAWGGIDTNGDGSFDRYIDTSGSTDPAAPPLGARCG